MSNLPLKLKSGSVFEPAATPSSLSYFIYTLYFVIYKTLTKHCQIYLWGWMVFVEQQKYLNTDTLISTIPRYCQQIMCWTVGILISSGGEGAIGWPQLDVSKLLGRRLRSLELLPFSFDSQHIIVQYYNFASFLQEIRGLKRPPSSSPSLISSSAFGECLKRHTPEPLIMRQILKNRR